MNRLRPWNTVDFQAVLADAVGSVVGSVVESILVLLRQLILAVICLAKEQKNNLLDASIILAVHQLGIRQGIVEAVVPTAEPAKDASR